MRSSLLMAVGWTRTSGLDCWTDGITRGQCCNAIFGRGGNSHCWDGQQFTFESCCGESYHATDCSAFVTHFSFSVVGFSPSDPSRAGDAWERCASAMDLEPHRCNSVNTSTRTCPECGRLSMYLPHYIQCVRLEQARPTPSASCPACAEKKGDDLGGGASAIVGGAHYPTLLRPRSAGREFSLLATAYDMTVGHQLISEGRWMQPEVDLLQAFLPLGGVAVDAGANIGGFALPLSRHAGPNGQVHAFEPFRVLHQVLTANCAINGLLSCFTYHYALGNKAEKRLRPMPGLAAVGNPSKSFVVDAVKSELLVHHDSLGRMETVSVVRLDDLLELERLDVMKIDVESGEYDMLLGAEQTIRRHQPVIYVEDSEADGHTSETPVVRLLRTFGYSCTDPKDLDLVLMTSTLCFPERRKREVLERIRRIQWTGPPR
ncbi:Methyltransferase sdnD (Sordarin/hypoxysordarin biosynthesis cluster protein D) [Durusdinium trenchii]|uniref:Methyltransferase sdnD (Sordarin/hypoxysordarin biosynthesis cluster protein D) n=1 Tax=Durusdinium trenchii TaxID=1381693 RepID=A0ABP0R3K8_9DINO